MSVCEVRIMITQYYGRVASFGHCPTRGCVCVGGPSGVESIVFFAVKNLCVEVEGASCSQSVGFVTPRVYSTYGLQHLGFVTPRLCNT